jgi:hypothetical protein
MFSRICIGRPFRRFFHVAVLFLSFLSLLYKGSRSNPFLFRSFENSNVRCEKMLVGYNHPSGNLAKQRLNTFVLKFHSTSLLPSFVFPKRNIPTLFLSLSLQNMRRGSRRSTGTRGSVSTSIDVGCSNCTSKSRGFALLPAPPPELLHLSNHNHKKTKTIHPPTHST